MQSWISFTHSWAIEAQTFVGLRQTSDYVFERDLTGARGRCTILRKTGGRLIPNADLGAVPDPH